jgi:hypothetical protein
LILPVSISWVDTQTIHHFREKGPEQTSLME